MRELRFRAWDKNEKVMIYADEAKNSKNLFAIGFHGLPIAVDYDSFRKDGEIIGWNVDHYLIPMQYTGLKDRKGTEIYEGDVLMVEGFGIGIVEYGKGCYRIRASDSLAALEDTSSMLIEVISNIYENPAYLLGL